jgi:ABC-2 type transport system permease protein
MRALWVLTKIRALEVLRQPSSTFWFFAMPALVFGVLAFVFQNGHPFEVHRVVLLGEHPAAQATLQAQEGVFVTHEPTVERAFARLDSADATCVVLGDGGGLSVVASPKDELFAIGLASRLTPKAGVTVRVPRPHGYLRFLYPGLLAQAVVLAGLFGMGYAMAKYRQSLFLKKLATMPLPRWKFVLSQMLARVFLVSLQMAFLVVLGMFTLGLAPSASGVLYVAAATVMGLFAFMGIGFLIAAVIKSESIVADVINAVSVPIALLSELFFSTESMPRALRVLSSALPSTALVRLYRHALLSHATADVSATTLQDFAVLGAWSVLTFAISLRVFRFT